MNTGRSLTELATLIEHQRDAKQDYIAPASLVRMRSVHDDEHRTRTLRVTLNDEKSFDVNDVAHQQIGSFTRIPREYYRRMQADAPELLAANVNRWLAQNEKDRRMVRTLDGTARAFMSDGYRPLDNSDLAEVVLPVIAEQGLDVLSCDVTDTKLYIKACDPKAVVKLDDGTLGVSGKTIKYGEVVPAIVISNSETGCGSLEVAASYYSHKCTNMHIFTEAIYRKIHSGKRADIGEELYAMLSTRTKQVTDAALWAQVGDMVRGAFATMAFETRLDAVRGLTHVELPGDPVKVVEVVSKKFSFTETERTSVLRHLIEGGDLSGYGLMNAVTRTAQDADSYDRATQLEGVGGQITALPKQDWARIVAAVAASN